MLKFIALPMLKITTNGPYFPRRYAEMTFATSYEGHSGGKRTMAVSQSKIIEIGLLKV